MSFLKVIILFFSFVILFGCNLEVKSTVTYRYKTSKNKTYKKYRTYRKYRTSRKYRYIYCYKVRGKKYCVKDVPVGYTQIGIASWYGPKFHGRKTASGEIYNMYDYTAAHKTLPLNTYVKVINLENGKSVVVRINDRGPFVKNRIIDLSYVAARKLGMIKKGTAKVKIIVLGKERRLALNGRKKTGLRFYSYKTIRKILKKYKRKNVILVIDSYRRYRDALRKYKYLKRKKLKVALRVYKGYVLVLLGPYKGSYILKNLRRWRKYRINKYRVLFVFWIAIVSIFKVNIKKRIIIDERGG